MRAPLPARPRWTAATLAVACVLALLGRAGLAADEPVALRDAKRAQLPGPDIDPFLGVVLDEHAAGARVAQVVPGSSADAAGLVRGDVITRVDAASIGGTEDLERSLRDLGIGARASLTIVRDGRTSVLKPTIGSRRRPDDCFRGGKFALAVVPVRFADDAASGAPSDRLTRLLFARTKERGAGASLADYYRDQSFGRLDVTGRVFDPVTLPSPRATYASQPMGGSPESAFAKAAALLEAREGAAARGFDGFAFLYAGRPETRSGFALWPHRSTITVGGRRAPYYVHFDDDSDAATIGVHCHEFGHLVGLPDAYGTGHVTGSGDFCLMAIGHRGGGRSGARAPFSLCAWCRVRLGWMEPAVLDPRTPQRVLIRPVARGPSEAVVVPLSPRTDEYLLLEVRRREGFDAELPSAGLLVWHVGGAPTPGQGRFGSYVDLVEAHGIDCVDASLVRTSEIAFPSARARDVTPDTTPPVRTAAPDGFSAHLTGIEMRADGSVAVTLGVPRRVAQEPPARVPAHPADTDGFVVRTDPVTGREVRLFLGSAGSGPVPPPAPALGGEERR